MRALFCPCLLWTSLLLPAVAARAQTPVPPPVAALACAQADYELQPPSSPASGNKLVITADQGQLEQGGLSALSGSVHLQQGDREFSASSLHYDDQEKQVRIDVESRFRNGDFIIKSRQALFDIDDGTGTFGDTQFAFPERGARGNADTITLDKTGNAEVSGASYTTCSPGMHGWMLTAREIELDKNEGLGTAHQATIRMAGVPILWLPYFQFPIDNRRRTGLLFPTIGDTNKTGFDLRVPFYLNLAPNYDATLTPRLMSTRGLQLATDARYLIRDGTGKVRAEYLKEDKQTGERRSYYQGDLLGLFSSRLGYGVHFGTTSDRKYFEDLGGMGDLASITHLERDARLMYQAPAAYSITAMAQSYQTISSNVLAADEPYARLPQIMVRARTKNSVLDTRLGFTGEYVNFVRANSVEGQRLDLEPALRMEKDHTNWYTELEADYRYTAYQLTNVSAGQPETPSRSLPQFSAEGGLRFDRLTDGGYLQTLEPYLYYLYTPFRDQDQLPLFDTGQPDFDYTQLFARNRFSGSDRISDANQFAVAARTRVLDPVDGEVRLSANVGQLFRLEESRVTAPGIATADSGPTDFFADLNYRISERWSTQLASDWSPNDRRFNRAGVALRYRGESSRFDLAYRYRRDLLEQADLVASLPLGGSWRAAARTRYSIRDHQPLDNLAGLEYDTCCYALRTSYRRFISNTAGEYSNGVYLQLELKGLTRIGTGFDDLLPMDQRLERSD